jgi:hypothetical protein
MSEQEPADVRTGSMSGTSYLTPESRGGAPVIRRWECRCARQAHLLATVDMTGRVHVKFRDRYVRVTGGRVEILCPLCGVLHMLDAGRV